MEMIGFRNQPAARGFWQTTLNLRSAGWFAGLWLIALVVATPDFAKAQTKFSPEHPRVKKMADQAVKTLQNGARQEGHNAMAALAIVEHGKRYNRRVPRDNSVVKAAVAHIRQQCANGKSFHSEKETYYPAIALILLAEVDAEANHSQILHLLEVLKKRQEVHGGYTYKRQDTGDCSQTQFAGLAMWVAKSHGFDVDIEMAKKTLNWFCKVSRGGQWSYIYNKDGQPQQGPTLSMQAAGISSVYLLADMLQLNRRVVDMKTGGRANEGLGLPSTVKIYVPPVEGKSRKRRGEGPLTSFDRGLLGGTLGAGNRSFENVFVYQYPRWNYYYLYAVERYCYFRQQAEGHLGGGKFENWYDGGVEYLASKQDKGGSFKGEGLMTEASATAFAVLFLVRSSEIISLPPAEGQMAGNKGFGEGVLKRTKSGKVLSSEAEQDLSTMISLLKDNDTLSSEQLARINESLKKQIVEFRNQDEKSRAEVQAFLRSMVGAKNYYRRLIAVRFLAGEQDMDNVPGLIYAVSDPDFRIAYEAHQGLRLVSRKIDSMKLSGTTLENARRDPGPLKRDSPQIVSAMRSEFESMEKRWSEWFLKIRPNAQLYKQATDEFGESTR